MRKITLNLLKKTIDWLQRKHDQFLNPKQDYDLKTVYTSIFPIDNADEDQHHSKALSWALNTRKENNTVVNTILKGLKNIK